MKAVGLYQYLPTNDAECLLDLDIAKPAPNGRDLLVAVKAISVNPVDTKVRAPKPTVETEPKILGWDVAGVVVEIGDQVTLFKPGDEVYYAGSIKRAGGNSEFHLVDERIVGKKPPRLTFEQAAALPLTTITAWEAYFERLGIVAEKTERNKRRSLLIIGGAGGVGSIAIQLAKQVAGIGTVIATAARPESQAWCKRMGADYCIDYRHGVKNGLEAIGITDVDYIFCLNSTETHFQGMVDVIKPQGKICAIVSTKNSVPLNISALQTKSVTFAWELMFTKAIFQTDDMQSQHDLLNRASSLFDNGTLVTTLNKTLGKINAQNLREAHRLIEAGDTIGKIVLSGF